MMYPQEDRGSTVLSIGRHAADEEDAAAASTAGGVEDVEAGGALNLDSETPAPAIIEISVKDLVEDSRIDSKEGAAAADFHPEDDPAANDADLRASSQRPLTSKEKWNLFLGFLAWACTICNVNLVVGSSSLVAMSIGASPDQSTFPLGIFAIGASSVSLLVTPWIFRRYGRKRGLLCGIVVGSLGTILSVIALLHSLPDLFLVATYCYGCAMGIGFFLRFAALELVPPHWASFAMAIVVGGGSIAAVVAPEAAYGTKNMFGDINDHPNLTYMGVILMTGIFNILNATFVSLIDFSPARVAPVASGEPSTSSTSTTVAAKAPTPAPVPKSLRSVLMSRHFLVPMSVATLSWAMMVLPMCVVRLAMFQLGFSPRMGVTVIECHFLGMYVTGFFSGRLIHRYGAKTMAIFSIPLSVLSIAVLQLVDASSVAVWIVGMVLLGVAWNVGFTSATMWTSQTAYDPVAQPHLKSPVQAANDCVMFLSVGVWVMSSTYIFESVGGKLLGWRVVSGGVLSAFLLVKVVILAADSCLDRRERKEGSTVLPLHH